MRENIPKMEKKNQDSVGFEPLSSSTSDQQSGVLTITPQRQLWVGGTENLSVAFSHA